MAWHVSFLAANAALVILVAYALQRPWIGEIPRVDGIRVWTPLALALATAGTAAVARLLPDVERSPFLRRHFALYLAVPAMLLIPLSGGMVLPPALGAPYLLIAVGFAVHALHGLWRVVDALSDRAAALAVAGVALIPFLILLPYNEASVVATSDEPHYMLIAQSLLYDGDFDLRNDYEGDRYLSFYPERLPDVHGFERGEAVYTNRDLGLPVLAALPLAVAGRIGVLLVICLVGAILVQQTYLLLRDLRFTPRVALLAVSVTALTHPLLTYTTQVYPELIAALAFVCAARMLRHRPVEPRHLAVASALIGLLPWLSTRALVIVAGIGLIVAYAALRPLVRPVPPEERRAFAREAALRLGAAALPFAALLAVLSYANWVMWDLFSPAAGYRAMFPAHFLITWTPHVGSAGMIFDRVFGLIPRAPVYLLAFVGLVAVWRRLRSGDLVMAGLALGWTLSFAYLSNIVFWHQDGGPSSRYLVASMPFLVAAVAGGFEVIESAGRWREALRATAAVVVGASVLVTYAFAVLPDLRYDYAILIAPTGGPGRLYQVVGDWLGLQPNLIFPSLLRIGPFSVALAVIWTAVAAGLALFGARIARRAAGP